MSAPIPAGEWKTSPYSDAELCERLLAYRPTNEWGDPVHHMIVDDAAEAITRLTAERDAARAGLEEIVCWFGEAPHTFPDWESCAEALADMAQNVLDGFPALTSREDRQARALLVGDGG